MNETKIDKVVSPIERIAILTKLIIQNNKVQLMTAIKMANDLACIIDELQDKKISSDKLEFLSTSIFPQHWQERLEFVKIVSHYWPRILQELGKHDVTATSNKEIKNNNKQYHDLVTLLNNIHNKIFIGQFRDTMDEIEYTVKLCYKYKGFGQKISLVSPGGDFTEQLYSRLSFCEDLDISVNFDKFDRDTMDQFLLTGVTDDVNLNKFLHEIDIYFSQYIGYDTKPYINCILATLLNYIEHDNNNQASDSDVTIITPSAIPYVHKNNTLILAMMTEEYWTVQANGSYWLHDIVRQKLNLQTFETSHNMIVKYFYSSFIGTRDIYFLNSKKHLCSEQTKSSILDKFETICTKHSIPIYLIHQEKHTEHKQSNKYTYAKDVYIQRNIPDIIQECDIRLLLKNQDAFYARCGLSLDDTSESEKGFSFLYNKLLSDYFCGCREEIMETNLKAIMEYDIFRYHQCRALIDRLQSYQDGIYARNARIRYGALQIQLSNQRKIAIQSHCIKTSTNDMLYFYYDKTMVEKRDFASRYGTILINSLIDYNGGFGNQENKETCKIFVIHLSSVDTIEEVQIKHCDCQAFLNSITYALKNYLAQDRNKITCDAEEMIKCECRRYKHFTRN